METTDTLAGDTRVALLVNFIPPYRVPIFRLMAAQFREFRIFISMPMEPGRHWPCEWGGLKVRVCRNISLQRTWKHPIGFSDAICIHVPYDTALQLFRYRPEVVISGEIGVRTLQAALYRLLFRN